MMRQFNDIGFSALLLAISLLFGWILWPFVGAILWAVVVAIVFVPLNDRIAAAMPGRPTPAALLTLLAILLIVILPALVIGASLVRQGTDLYAAVQSGRLDLPDLTRRIFNSLPGWVTDFAGRYGIYDAADLQERLVNWATASSQLIASRAVSIGQGTFGFVVDLALMLYLLFFLLRDGHALAATIEARLPLEPTRRRALLDKVSVVVRATVKGGLLIALLQGALGGFIFWVRTASASPPEPRPGGQIPRPPLCPAPHKRLGSPPDPRLKAHYAAGQTHSSRHWRRHRRLQVARSHPPPAGPRRQGARHPDACRLGVRHAALGWLADRR